MQIKAELPDDIARHADPGHEALEALAIEGYRSGALTHYQASQLLGLSRFEFDGFLKDRNVYDHAYDAEDLEQDLETLRQIDAAFARLRTTDFRCTPQLFEQARQRAQAKGRTS